MKRSLANPVPTAMQEHVKWAEKIGWSCGRFCGRGFGGGEYFGVRYLEVRRCLNPYEYGVDYTCIYGQEEPSGAQRGPIFHVQYLLSRIYCHGGIVSVYIHVHIHYNLVKKKEEFLLFF